jgi:hypothetical protein
MPVCPSVRLSVRPQSFPDFFPLCVQLLHWNFVHGFICMTYRSSSKMVAIDQFLGELCPLRNFTVFRTFFLSAYWYSFDIWYIALPYLDTDQVWVWFWSIHFSRSYGPWTLKKNHEFLVLRTFFLVFIWYLVHGFAIPRYRSSMSLVLIQLFFTKLWPLDLEKNHELIVFRTFFRSANRYSFNIWYIALQYQATYWVWVWRWSNDFSRSYGPWT